MKNTFEYDKINEQLSRRNQIVQYLKKEDNRNEYFNIEKERRKYFKTV